MLENAVFDATVTVHPLEGSVVDVNPTMNEFVENIDYRAEALVEWMKVGVHVSDAKRYGCYSAAEGTAAFVNMTSAPLLVKIDPVTYFQDTLPALKAAPSSIPGPRRTYKLAYLFLVHEIAGFKQLETLIDILDDGTAILLIHVDSRSSDLHLLVSDLLQTREKTLHNGSKGNIHLTKHRAAGAWGHISLVYAQLLGFFELRDLADWDFVINLSNYEWPLASNAEILRTLEKHGKKSWIEYWVETNMKHNHHHPEFGLTNRPFPNWTIYKHHQWMILTREAVDFLRSDHDALFMLAFMEHTYIPDESFFATVLLNSRLKNEIINDSKRYLRFDHPGAPHPALLGYKDRVHFPPGQPEPLHFFARKINNVLGSSQQLVEWIRSNLLEFSHEQKCEMDQIGWRNECLEAVIEQLMTGGQSDGDDAPEKELLIVPVSKSTIHLLPNLRCSLNRTSNYYEIIHWALDIQSHDALLDAGMISLYLYDAVEGDKVHTPERMMQAKPRIVQRILGSFAKLSISDVPVWVVHPNVIVTSEGWNSFPQGEKDVMLLLGRGTKDNQATLIPVMRFKPSHGVRRFLSDCHNAVSLSSSTKVDEHQIVTSLMANYSQSISESEEEPRVEVGLLEKALFVDGGEPERDAQDALKNKGGWFLDENGGCMESRIGKEGGAE
ncbi:hypothetical protein HK104_002685 [Borealophlyctis nickersoniae]|nr:hypothetical protein HK104_002685 [Borealophlyctis nickersoniae]